MRESYLRISVYFHHRVSTYFHPRTITRTFHRTVSNVFSFVADKTGYKNVHIPADEVPLFNLTGVVPGALSACQAL